MVAAQAEQKHPNKSVMPTRFHRNVRGHRAGLSDFSRCDISLFDEASIPMMGQLCGTCSDQEERQHPHLQVVKEQPAVIAHFKRIKRAMVLVQPVQNARRLVIMEVVQQPLAVPPASTHTYACGCSECCSCLASMQDAVKHVCEGAEAPCHFPFGVLPCRALHMPIG